MSSSLRAIVLVAVALVIGLVLGRAAFEPVDTAPHHASAAGPTPSDLYVDPKRGRDKNAGTKRRPFRSVGAALRRLPEPLVRRVTIHLAPGVYEKPHAQSSEGTLYLAHRMRPKVWVTFAGVIDEKRPRATFAWKGGTVVDVREGHWRFENVQIGSFSTKQRTGIRVAGPAHAELRDVRFRTRSHSGGGIHVHRGGWVTLRGKIEMNEHLHDQAEEETFCGIISEDHGRVKFAEREGASLSMGNGSLSAGYYGVIRLGCETARITSWGRQSNNLAVNNSGRVDLHGTDTTLVAKVEENTPIGPEHDGHILAEDAKITIRGKNTTAITLQKSSTLTCNDIALEGEFRKTIWAMSGSMFTGRFLTDITNIEAHTGAIVCIEKLAGAHMNLRAYSGAVISIPGVVVRGDK